MYMLKSKQILYLMFYLLLFCTVTNTYAQEQNFSSGIKQNILLELYTSEGCSSCPPADKWLSQLKQDKRLWKQIIPIAFHVDYWDYLGWQDRFASAAYSKRQRTYAQQGYAQSVYTPGFFSNGNEWRDFFHSRKLPSPISKSVGELHASLDAPHLTVTYSPIQKTKDPLTLNIVMLGNDLITHVRQGENSGRKLKHDFVVLNHKTTKLNYTGEIYQWSGQISKQTKFNNSKPAIAFWVSKNNDPLPIQVTGGWIR